MAERRSESLPEERTMQAKTPEAVDTADREITITRVFNAPRELVFKAWTDPKHVDRWWGPRGFQTQTSEMDMRPGGVWRFVMHREITKRARVALFSRRFAGLLGGIVLAALTGLQYGWIVYVLALWIPVAYGEWTALQYARERGLPGAEAQRLPIY